MNTDSGHREHSDFKSVVGEYVQEYQFTNILPGGIA